MNRFTLLLFAFSIVVASARQCTAVKTTVVAKLVKTAKPGQAVLLPPGVYRENIVVPPGVSLVGTDARKTVIIGSVELSGTADNPVRFSRISIFNSEDGVAAALFCQGGFVRVQHCLLVGEAGFCTVHMGRGAKALLRNNIIVGPAGQYAIFGRYEAQIEVINNTVIVQGFGIGLMDQSYATIRNCLFDAIRKPTIVRTYSDYSISYSNISFSGNTPRYDDDLQNHDIVLLRRPPYPLPGTSPALSLKDVPKYDSVGLTFIQQEHFKSHDIDKYRKNLPKFAVHAGSPEASDENADGTRNTLGAFGGPFGNWWK